MLYNVHFQVQFDSVVVMKKLVIEAYVPYSAFFKKYYVLYSNVTTWFYVLPDANGRHWVR